MLKRPVRATLLAALLALPLAAPATEANTGSLVRDSGVKHMGHGNVDIALSLAKATLAERGIHRPTPEQIKRERDGILKQRASGMGWGKIAQAHGLKLGEVMRNKHHRADHKRPEHKDFDRKHDREHADRKQDRNDFHKVRFERRERHERPERHERHERPERYERYNRY
jgi:hypothetical protein